MKIVDFFKDKQFQTSKGKSFELWVKCLELIRQRKHLPKEGLLEICRIRDKMNPKLGGKVSRDAELIEKLLEAKPEHIQAHVAKEVTARRKLSLPLHNGDVVGVKDWYRKRKGKHQIERVLPVTSSPEPNMPEPPK